MRSQARLIGAVLLVAVAALGTAGSAFANRGNPERTIRMQDDCDAATFNAAVGPGTCVGDGRTAFADFLAAITPTSSPARWGNHPHRTHIKDGRGLHVLNRGGEFHTFTEVAQFGPGCVEFLNDLMGLGGMPPAADCGAAFNANTALPAGAQADISAANLSPGVHRFQCMIHPWMHTTVTVRPHH